MLVTPLIFQLIANLECHIYSSSGYRYLNKNKGYFEHPGYVEFVMKLHKPRHLAYVTKKIILRDVKKKVNSEHVLVSIVENNNLNVRVYHQYFKSMIESSNELKSIYLMELLGVN